MQTGLSAAAAQRWILEETPVLPAERCAAADALSRVLAEDIMATRTLPPWDVSAMDGYAARAADLAHAASEEPAELIVAFEIAAGAGRERAIGPGECARIFTGAPIPPGADLVVRQEDVDREAGRARFRAPLPAGENVREAGEDLRSGDAVLAAGTALGAAELGVLASLGRTTLAVRQRPRVAVLSSGDELIEPDGELAPGRIVSSNSYSLLAQAREAGADPTYLGIARDRPEALEEALRGGLSAHVLVSSAGVSVGDRDYVRPVLEKLGCQLLFWGVRIKPGFPLVFGRFGERGPLVFGLPGNPVSAMVTFEQFVRPALRKMAGHARWYRPRVRAHLEEDLHKNAGRLHLVRVTLERRGDAFAARSTGNQSSGVLRSMARADGLLIFPAEAEHLAAGAEVDVQVLDPDLLSAADSGLEPRS